MSSDGAPPPSCPLHKNQSWQLSPSAGTAEAIELWDKWQLLNLPPRPDPAAVKSPEGMDNSSTKPPGLSSLLFS